MHCYFINDFLKAFNQNIMESSWNQNFNSVFIILNPMFLLYNIPCCYGLFLMYTNIQRN